LAGLFIIILKLVFHLNNITCKSSYLQSEVNIKLSDTFSHFKIGQNKPDFALDQTVTELATEGNTN
jgi:hypothetical protein